MGLYQPHFTSESDDMGDWDDKGRARQLNLYNLNAVKNLGFFPSNSIQVCITSMRHMSYINMVFAGETSGLIQAR